MPLFDKDDVKIHFVHVPRTGGRYVAKLFEHNNFIVQHGDDESIKSFNGVFAIHLYNPLYKVFPDYNQRSEFCIVRNPLDKFVSSITQMHNYHKIDYNFLLESQKVFDQFIQEEIENRSKHNSWFLDQYLFISEKTKVWKFEDGFNEKFLRWIEQNFNVKLDDSNLGKEIYKKNIWCDSYSEDNVTKKYKFNDMNLIAKYVKNRYLKDYTAFGY